MAAGRGESPTCLGARVAADPAHRRAPLPAPCAAVPRVAAQLRAPRPSLFAPRPEVLLARGRLRGGGARPPKVPQLTALSPASPATAGLRKLHSRPRAPRDPTRVVCRLTSPSRIQGRRAVPETTPIPLPTDSARSAALRPCQPHLGHRAHPHTHIPQKSPG